MLLILIVLSFISVAANTVSDDLGIKYTVTPRLEPWGTQRINGDKKLWDKDIHQQNTPGLRLTFPDTSNVDLVESDIWEIAGWSFYFIQLKKGETYHVPKTGHLNHVVVHRGDLRTNKGDTIVQIMAPPHEIINTFIDSDVKTLKAQVDSIFSIWRLDPLYVKKEINNMMPDSFSNDREVSLRGLYGNIFRWVRFHEYFPDSTGFDDDFFSMRGFELYDSKGERVLYVQFWTAGQGVNCGWHDHQELTPEASFADVHLSLVAAGGGMQWIEDDGTESDLLVLKEGYSHGPIFETNDDWTPVRIDGVVLHPTHRWVNYGNNTKSENAYDLWVSLEYHDITSTAANI